MYVDIDELVLRVCRGVGDDVCVLLWCRGMSYGDLGECVGLSRSSVCRFMVAENLDFRRLMRICVGLGVCFRVELCSLEEFRESYGCGEVSSCG